VPAAISPISAAPSIRSTAHSSLAKRSKYAAAALQFKTDRKSIGNPAHRKKLFAQRSGWAAKHGLNDKMVRKVFQAIVDESKRMHLAGFRKR